MNDIRYAFRMLRRQRGFTALAVLTMGVGIGIVTTLSSVAYGVLFKPLPWPEPDRLVRLSESHEGATMQLPLMMTNAAYLPWTENPTMIEDLGAWRATTVAITAAGSAERIRVASVTAGMFRVVRARPLIGALFTAESETSQSEVILSFGLWQKRFAESPAALGQTLPIDGKAYRIVGVMPSDFVFPDRSIQLWMPLQVLPVIGKNGSRSIMSFSALARLRPGVTPEQAAAEATARARSGPDAGMAALAFFGTKGPAIISAVPALAALTADVRPALIALIAAVALLLVTAVANVASLQLARAATRHREIAIRAAIGAGSQRIARQLIAENLLTGFAGGAVGLLIAVGLHRVLPSILPSDFPRIDNVVLDVQVAAFAFALTLLTGLAIGVLPALYLRRVNLVECLLEDGTATAGGRRTRVPRLRMVIMVGQVAIACVLLIGGALLSRSFMAMMNADRGYDPKNLLTARIAMPDSLFTTERKQEILNAAVTRLQSMPGVTYAAYSDALPLGGSQNLSAYKMASKRQPLGVMVDVHTVRHVVTEDYLNALGMRVVEGRSFRRGEAMSADRVVVVNRMFAAQYLSEKPIGDRISGFAAGDGIEYEVIGVIDNVIEQGLNDPVQPEIFSLTRQTGFRSSGPGIVVRTTADPRLLADSLKSIMREQDSSLALDSIVTMENRVATSLAKPRFYALLLGVFAVSSLLIAGVGLFGVLSYNVAQRTREFAVRTALGARPGDVLALVLKQGIGITLAGLGVGVWVSFALTKYLSGLLYGVGSHDGASFIVVSVTIAFIAIVACVIPALRAIRIDPIRALRM